MASEYLKWKYRNVRPDEPPELTKKQKAANWWQYHRWWLLVGALLLVAAGDILYHALGIGVVEPDYQLACVVSVPLGDDTLRALEDRLSALGEDCNDDGKVVVRANPYVDMAASGDSDAARYAAAAKIKLMADLESCESYFFISNDPETLHEAYEVLARPDGEIAESPDSVACYPVSQVLAADHPELSGLYLARRGFWQDRTCKYKAQCDALWGVLTEGAAS